MTLVSRTPIPIVALDVGSAAEAMALAKRVGDGCSFFKVGSELFTAEGPSIVRRLREELGADVFLDLKFHDIPNTVAGSVRSAAALGVRLVTVHGGGGSEMLRAAQRAAEDAGGGCGVLAVTVLTSLDAPALAAAWGRDTVAVEQEVLRLAGGAVAAGLHGVVCSGAEAAAVQAAHGEGLATLVPGIRFAGGGAQDQQRVMTPAGARAAGARYVILGRAVTAASDPREAMARARTELGAELGKE